MTHFNLEEQWQRYLKHFDIDEELLTGLKEQELKTAFVAGIQSLLSFLCRSESGFEYEAMTHLQGEINDFLKQLPRLEKQTFADAFGRKVTIRIKIPENYIRDITDNT